MKPRKRMISKVISAADLDAELEYDLPIIELAGNHQVLIENHQSVIGYSTESICIKVRFGCVCVRGNGLMIARMSSDQLVILGDIQCVQLSRGQKR